MTVVISPERAFADGISPESLILVAQWHQDRVRFIDAYWSLSKTDQKKVRRPGFPADADRHERIAIELRAVASHMERVLVTQVAA